MARLAVSLKVHAPHMRGSSREAGSKACLCKHSSLQRVLVWNQRPKQAPKASSTAAMLAGRTKAHMRASKKLLHSYMDH